ncbi:nicotine N-demethylase CYP82E3-like [Lycium barbarum]|uniref:nicotine N-demethylase CYP82E3-like n=1 Tax=Lycium barbarum TaxID=112863 RepID=UPI00293F5A40|nr:nicotine N-demethylase CYP82E3-like [Lycium barbarum]
MDYHFSSNLQAVLGLLAFVFLSIILWRRKTFTTKKLAPEVPGAWPIIGHFLQLSGTGENIPFARTLGVLADKYGPIFTLRMGMYPYLIISNWEAAKDCLTTHDKDFAARPTSMAGQSIGYKYARFTYSEFGAYYSQVRKLALTQVLSSTKLEKMRHIRVSEMENSIKDLYSLTQVKKNDVINISEWFHQLTLNIIVKTICGKRYNKIEEDEEAKRFRKAFKGIMYVVGQIVVYDAVPFPLAKYFDFQGHIKLMKNIYKDLDSILQGWLDDHMKKKGVNNHEDEDAIDAMLRVTDVNEFKAYGYSQATVIKSTVLSLILDGSGTTSVHLIWIMSLLLNNPHAMKQAQDEIDTKVGKERWVEESDIKNLVYLQAIVKETSRLYPPVPLLLPHEAVQDCQVAGYDIPKGTRLYINAWKIHRDPNIWSEPEKFMPERFLTSKANIDAGGQHFEFIPFGSGRQSCPGKTFATLLTHLTFARLLQGFDFSKSSNKPIDMTEGVGITLPNVNQVEVLVTSRLSSKLYDK